jgi:hypothetical protein
MLALAVLPWAQTSASNASPSTMDASNAKSKCPCCQKMGEGKDTKSCCAHHDMSANDGKAMSCCSGGKSCMSKDGKSCMKDDKTMAAACAKAGCCKTAKEGKAMACCGEAQCRMHHDDQPIAK